MFEKRCDTCNGVKSIYEFPGVSYTDDNFSPTCFDCTQINNLAMQSCFKQLLQSRSTSIITITRQIVMDDREQQKLEHAESFILLWHNDTKEIRSRIEGCFNEAHQLMLGIYYTYSHAMLLLAPNRRTGPKIKLSIPDSLKRQIFTGQKGFCAYCSRSLIPPKSLKLQDWVIGKKAAAGVLDHRIPLVRGGAPRSIENLVYACYACNSKKGRRTDTEFLIDANDPIDNLKMKYYSAIHDHRQELVKALNRIHKGAATAFNGSRSPYYSRYRQINFWDEWILYVRKAPILFPSL